MTESEAIKICNTIIFASSLSNPQGTTLNTTKDELEEAMGMAIQALEKQIPKKPNDEIKTIPVIDEDGAYVDADTYVYLLCPICGNQVGIDDCIDNYCSCCGQKLDWSDKE